MGRLRIVGEERTFRARIHTCSQASPERIRGMLQELAKRVSASLPSPEAILQQQVGCEAEPHIQSRPTSITPQVVQYWSHFPCSDSG